MNPATATPRRELLEGATAIARAAIAAGCRFFAGYPMPPFTALLEQHGEAAARERRHLHQRRDRDRGRQHGAWRGRDRRPRRDRLVRPGHRADAGDDRRGRAQRDCRSSSSTWRAASRTTSSAPAAAAGATTGLSTLAPKDVAEAVEHTQSGVPPRRLATACRRSLYGDHLIAQTQMTFEIAPLDLPPTPAEGLGARRQPRGTGRSRRSGPGPWARRPSPAPVPTAIGARSPRSSTSSPPSEQRWRGRHGSRRRDAGRRVRVGRPSSSTYVVDELRAEGRSIGTFRPITLWPFPGEALAAATPRARRASSSSS